LSPPRKLRFTREGKYYLIITIGVGLAAINTGNNLLYLLLGMLLSLIIVSGVMSEISLRHLTVSRKLPARAQAGRAHLIEIEVFNHKRRFPSYAIEVEDLRAGQPADKRCFFLKISPRSAQIAAYRRRPHRRGKDLHTGFRVATRFPFGLFEKSLLFHLDGELIIYPAIDPVRLPHDQAGNESGINETQGRGMGDEIVGVRPMRDGDDPREIYWRKSTLPGQHVLKERARETRPRAELSLDDVSLGKPTPEWELEFERRIKQVASCAVAHIRRGNAVKLATSSGHASVANVGTGADPILRFLALIEPHQKDTDSTKAPPDVESVTPSQTTNDSPHGEESR